MNYNHPYLTNQISVIIPTKNEDDVIQACLSSVFEQSIKPLEVIVIDGLSTDSTIEKARRFPVTILFETKPTSLPKARNLGIQQAKGDILLIMDADVVLSSNCLKNALQYFNDPNIMTVIPSQDSPPHTYLEKIQARWFFGTLNPIRMGIGAIAPVQFIRKDIFRKIKYDPTLGYGEDADFNDKLHKLCNNSKRIIYAPDIKISVHFPHTFRELQTQYLWYGRTFKTYFAKNHSIKTILNLGSLLLPTIIVFLFGLTLVVPEIFYVFLLSFSLLGAKNILACYRSRSIHFIEFVSFEFTRSIIFFIGLVKGFFGKKIGK